MRNGVLLTSAITWHKVHVIEEKRDVGVNNVHCPNREPETGRVERVTGEQDGQTVASYRQTTV